MLFTESLPRVSGDPLILSGASGLVGVSSFGGVLQFDCITTETCDAGQLAAANTMGIDCPIECPSTLACAANYEWCAPLAEPRKIGHDPFGYRNYQNFWRGVVTVFVQTANDGGVHTMPEALKKAGVKLEFVSWILSFLVSILLNLVTLNLFLAVCCSAYSDVAARTNEFDVKVHEIEESIRAEEIRKETAEEREARLEKEAQEVLSKQGVHERMSEKVWTKEHGPDHSHCAPVREALRKLVLSEPFETVTSFVIVGNTITMAMAHSDMDPELASTLLTLETAFLVSYCLEAVLKFLGSGRRLYFAANENRFDLFVIISSLIGFVSTFFPGELEQLLGIELQSMQSFRAVRLLRALQIVRLLHRQKALIMIMKTIFKAWKPLLWHSLFCLFSMSVFSIIGMHMFGG